MRVASCIGHLACGGGFLSGVAKLGVTYIVAACADGVQVGVAQLLVVERECGSAQAACHFSFVYLPICIHLVFVIWFIIPHSFQMQK